MMRTGLVESWNINPLEVGPLYPFVGWEMPMFVVCVAFFMVFLVWKFRMENAKYAAAVRKVRESGQMT